jgi:O-antigen/teichoic acid export membrane protein
VGPSVYGAWLASGDLLNWIQVLDLGLPNLLIQRVGAAHGIRDEPTSGRWFLTGALVLGMVALTLTGAGVLFASQVPRLFHLTGGDADLLRGCFSIGCLAAGITLFNSAFVGLGRAIQETHFINGVMITASLVGLLTALALLWRGMGLWAVALAMLIRALVALGGGAWFLLAVVPRSLRREFHMDRGILHAYFKSVPATAIGGIGYALASQSETAIVGIMANPQMALVYNLTRKAADVGKTLVDMVGFASYGGFAHLVASSRPAEVRRVYLEIRFLRLAAAIAMACAYLLVNHALLRVWVGESAFGGAVLTWLFAVQLVVTGESFLVSYLFRASGEVEKGSWVLAAEALLRMASMLVGMRFLGVRGIPITGILVSIPFLVWVDRLLMRKALSPAPLGETWRMLGRTYLQGGVLLILLGYVSAGVIHLGWPAIIGIGSLVWILVFLALFLGAAPIARAKVLSLTEFLPHHRSTRD